MKKRDFIKAISRKTQEDVVILHESAVSPEPGRPVTSEDLATILPDATAMLRALAGVGGPFAGPYKTAYALAHHQIRKDHWQFFACRPDVAGHYGGSEILLNPMWRSEGDEEAVGREGCMTHENRGDRPVSRPAMIVASWDYAKDGGTLERREMRLTGIAARIFMHETDHTLGKTIFTRV